MNLNVNCMSMREVAQFANVFDRLGMNSCLEVFGNNAKMLIRKDESESEEERSILGKDNEEQIRGVKESNPMELESICF